MTRDDLENYESRVSDRRLFENLAILLIGASVPLGVEKYLELRDEAGDPPSSTEGILIVCAGAALFGLIAGVVAVVRAIRVKRYRKKLFSSEKQVAALTFLQSGTVQPTPTSAQEGSDD